MAKPKHKYEVYWIGTGHGCYAENYCKEFLGTTWAVSEKQAVNNIHHRTGFPFRDELGDYLEEGYVIYALKAVAV